MVKISSSVVYHILIALGAAKAEMEENEHLAKELHSKVKLSLMRMSEEELTELAELTSAPANRSDEFVYEQQKGSRQRIVTGQTGR